eukprot:TRINITY_DN14982_c0_g1_i3.p1 TRINITY_DN14982_c0_g1~~TRINITY_DN14982_c0_g1_i3.p1  ORF type:complete len:210 (-),score=40.56 TRINITY_DN14982_c0_g1_i3:127-756(-)
MKGLALRFHSRGLLVTGDTFPVKEELKALKGRWDAMLQGWLFPFDGKQKLLQGLRENGISASMDDRAKVSLVLGGCSQGISVSGETYPIREFLRESGGVWDSKLKGWAFKDVTSTQLAKQLKAFPDVSASTANSKSKVEETAKRTVKTTRKEGGSREGLQVDKKRQKISCKSTGAHIQTTSVTKKRRIQETKGKVIETRTVVVKRVRNK